MSDAKFQKELMDYIRLKQSENAEPGSWSQIYSNLSSMILSCFDALEREDQLTC